MSCLSSPPCAGIDCLIEPLRSTIQAKAKAVKQEQPSRREKGECGMIQEKTRHKEGEAGGAEEVLPQGHGSTAHHPR